MESTLHKIYHDPAHPAGLASLNKLRIAAGEASGVTPPISQVKHYLEQDDTYTLHKPVRIHFPRNRVLVTGVDKQFQADLVDMCEYVADNDNVRYLLTCIDVFSKYAWVRCLTNKTANVVSAAFEDILSEGRIPVKLQTDEGKEFYNTTFKQLMKRYNIKHFSTASEVKCSIVERFNRTFKGRMWKYLTSANSRRYVDVIPDLTQAYNNAYHRSIQMAPAEVNKDNEKSVFNALYKMRPQKELCFKFNIGDTVRISKLRGKFRKGYEQTYTDEIFTVKERIGRQPPVYRLADLAGEVLKGSFYEPEIQRVVVDENKTFKIENILARKKVGRKKHVLVKWLGWPDSFNSWIPEKDIVEA